MKRELMTLAATVGLTMTANAAIIAQSAGSETTFTLTSDALGAAATVTATGGYDAWSKNPNILKNNSLGAGGEGADADAFAVVSGTSITYTFDTSGSNSRGYDLTKIQTYAGWNHSEYNGRSNQGYAVELTLVGGATTTLLAKTTWPNEPTQYWTQITLVNDTDPGVALLATGVQAVTFKNFDDATAATNTPVAYREIDIYGTATVPEPAAASLLLLGAAAVGLRRRILR